MNQQIVDALSQLLSGLSDTFWHLREFDLPKSRIDESKVFDVSSLCCFQLGCQFTRPDEFLQALLDMLKVTYYHDPFGTLLLNSNPAFIIESVPEKPFRFGYLSVLSQPNESFSDLWNGKVADALRQNHYDLEQASAVFLVVSAGEGRYGVELIDEVGVATNAGFSIEEVFSRIAADIKDEASEPLTGIHAGYVFCEELDLRLRVSLWMFLKSAPNQPFTVIPGGKQETDKKG